MGGFFSKPTECNVMHIQRLYDLMSKERILLREFNMTLNELGQLFEQGNANCNNNNNGNKSAKQILTLYGQFCRKLGRLEVNMEKELPNLCQPHISQDLREMFEESLKSLRDLMETEMHLEVNMEKELPNLCQPHISQDLRAVFEESLKSLRELMETEMHQTCSKSFFPPEKQKVD